MIILNNKAFFEWFGSKDLHTINFSLTFYFVELKFKNSYYENVGRWFHLIDILSNLVCLFSKNISGKIALINPYASFFHAQHLQSRFINGEKAISKSPLCSYEYAEKVLNERFILGEPSIGKIDFLAFRYSYFILKSRFKLGENTIAKNDFLIRYYFKEHFLSHED